MSNFSVFPLPISVAVRIKETRPHDFGHRLSVSVATENDTGPCRSCLTVFAPGEGRLLFSYAPNQYDHPYNEMGAAPLERRRFPEKSGILPNLPIAERGLRGRYELR